PAPSSSLLRRCRAVVSRPDLSSPARRSVGSPGVCALHLLARGSNRLVPPQYLPGDSRSCSFRSQILLSRHLLEHPPLLPAGIRAALSLQPPSIAPATPSAPCHRT